MTPPKRWPDHAEWARVDAIARMEKIIRKCDKLLSVPIPDKVKMVVMEIKMLAMETEAALRRVKDGGK